jgi:hypothetical protein
MIDLVAVGKLQQERERGEVERADVSGAVRLEFQEWPLECNGCRQEGIQPGADDCEGPARPLSLR